MSPEEAISEGVGIAGIESGGPDSSIDPLGDGDQVDASVEPALVILYIEDNVTNLRLIERVVARRPGVSLISAMHGRAGVEMAREHRPDLIFLDLHLPDMHGSEVLRMIRSEVELASVPVVIVSADATSAGIDSLLVQGADDYLTKPVDVMGLLDLIDGALADGPTAGADVSRHDA